MAGSASSQHSGGYEWGAPKYGNGKGSSHVPFRDSKLTRLLTDSLGGNTKTVLCANVGPALHNYDETFCTLLLATRAMAVKTHARVNERVERQETSAPERQALLAHLRVTYHRTFSQFLRPI